MGLRRKSVFLTLLLVLSLFAAACGGSDDGDDGGGLPDTRQDDSDAEVQEGGTVVFGAEQEPSILATFLTDGNLFWGNVIVDPILPDTYQLLPDFTYEPQLLDGEAEITEDPFTITYKIKDEAVWSDGTPISAEDFEFTWQAYVDEKNDMVDRTGYDLIDDAEIIDEKTIKFNFSKPFAGYKEIFDDIFPKHVLEGENLNKVWNDEIPISGGPFQFDSWEKGNQLTLTKNEAYWGEPAHLDEVTFRFITDTNSEVQALRGGEVDAIYPQPQLQLSEVATFPDVQVQATAGTVWEHLDFQRGNPLLEKDYIRQAIALGIDRQAIVDQFIKPLQDDAEPLQNGIWVTNQAEYEPHYQIWDYDPEAAEALLTDNGCEKVSGTYECEGEKLEFGYVSTSGNELRELQFEAIQQQLKQIGISVKSEFGSPDVVFGKVLSSKNWDMFNFAWVGSPDPAGSVEIFQCDGGNNFTDYCNEEVTKLLQESNNLIDPVERAAVLNEADAIMAEDLPLLPLYQKPTFLAFSSKIHNMEDNATNEGPTWNIGEWWVEQ